MNVKGNFEIRQGQSVVWKGFKHSLKDHDKHGKAYQQFKYVWEEYNQKFSGINGYITFIDDKGLCELLIR